MDSKKLVFSAAIIAIIFGNIYAGKYTLHIVQYIIGIIKNVTYKSYIIVLHLIMYVLRLI